MSGDSIIRIAVIISTISTRQQWAHLMKIVGLAVARPQTLQEGASLQPVRLHVGDGVQTGSCGCTTTNERRNKTKGSVPIRFKINKLHPETAVKQ